MKRIENNLIEQTYAESEVVFVTIYKQVSLYIKHGAPLIDIYYDTEKEKLVHVFKKTDTRELYKLWNSHELV